MLKPFSRLFSYESEKALLDRLSAIASTESVPASQCFILLSSLSAYTASADLASIAKFRNIEGLSRLLACLPHHCDSFKVSDVKCLAILTKRLPLPVDMSLRRITPALVRLLNTSGISDVLSLATLISEENLLSKSLWEIIVKRLVNTQASEYASIDCMDSLPYLVRHRAQFPVKFMRAMLPVFSDNLTTMNKSQLLAVLQALSMWPSCMKRDSGNFRLAKSIINKLLMFGPLSTDAALSVSVLTRRLGMRWPEPTFIAHSGSLEYDLPVNDMRPVQLLDLIISLGRMGCTLNTVQLLEVAANSDFPDSIRIEHLAKGIHYAVSMDAGKDSARMFFLRVEPLILRGIKSISFRSICLLMKDMCNLAVGSRELWLACVSRVQCCLKSGDDLSVVEVASAFAALCEMRLLSSGVISMLESIIFGSIQNLTLHAAIDTLWSLTVMNLLHESALSLALFPVITCPGNPEYKCKFSDILVEKEVVCPDAEIIHDRCIAVEANCDFIPSAAYNDAVANLRSALNNLNVFPSADVEWFYRFKHHQVEVAALDMSTCIILLDRERDFTHLGNMRGTCYLKLRQLSRIFGNVLVLDVQDCSTVASAEASFGKASGGFTQEVFGIKNDCASQVTTSPARHPPGGSRITWSHSIQRSRYTAATLPWQSNEVFKLQKKGIYES